MTEFTAGQRKDNLAGSLWMVAAMAMFALEDTAVKTTAAHMPIAQVLVLFGLAGALLFAIAAILKREAIFSPDVLSRPMRVRACFEVTGRLFYALALALTSLSSTTVILQATPIVVVLGAAIIFRERVGWQRWMAILIGLAGVLIVLRPGEDSFSPLSVLALIGTLGFAGRDLASRAAPRSIATSVLGFYGFAAVVLAGVAYALLWERKAFIFPDANAMVFLSAGAVCGALAYAALMKAMRIGAVSVVTPFRYTRLLFGVALGVIAFGERLDVATIVGSLIIVLSGIIILNPFAARRLARAGGRQT